MVIGAMIRRRAREQGRKKGREEGREEGRKEGQATVQKLWTEWNQRRLAAEARANRSARRRPKPMAKTHPTN